MSQHIDAIFENGVFRPLQPVELPEQTRVQVTIESAEGMQEYQRQFADLQKKLLVAEQQSDRGETAAFDAKATKQRLRDRLAQEGTVE